MEMSRITSFISKIFGSQANTNASRHAPLEDNPYAEPGLVDADVSPTSGAYFPLTYLTDMFKFIDAHSDRLSIMTYNDLAGDSFTDYAQNYATEFKAWNDKIKSDPDASKKAHLLFQYDIDNRTERMADLLSHPAHDSVPANIMLFNERIDRRRFKNTGVVATTDYDIHADLLRKRQAEGFVIGYHCNAYELAGHDTDKAMEIFDRDMTRFQTDFGSRVFSAHGGVPDAKGKNNNGLPYHPDWIGKAIWVHNGVNLRFHGVFSDGGHNSPKRDPQGRDIRDFFETLQPGKRYRMLLHPQYYGVDYGVSKRFAGTPWYDRMIWQSRKEPHRSLWDDVTLRF